MIWKANLHQGGFFMKNWMKIILGAQGVGNRGRVIWFAAPGLVVKAYTAVEMRKAGLSHKSMKVGTISSITLRRRGRAHNASARLRGE